MHLSTNRKLLIISIPIIIFLAYLFYKNKTSTPAITYQTTTAEQGNIVVTLQSSGTISSTNVSPITTSSTGVVKTVYVKNGDLVRSGQMLAQLELDQVSLQKYQSALSSYKNAKNSLASAQTNLYTLQSKLFAANQKLINDAVARGLATNDPTYIQQNADWLAAESTYKSQQDAISAAQNNLTSASLSLQQVSPVILAPISGKLAGFSLEPGSIVTSTKVGSIITSASPLVQINLTEVDVPKVKVGQVATVTLDAFPDKTFTGTVNSIDTSGSVSSNVTVYPTTIKLDTTPDNLYPNMSAQANIRLAYKENVLLLPNSALTTQNGQTTVRLKKGDTLTTQVVQTGLVSDTQTEIISGISAGDLVVTSTSSAPTTSATSTQSLFSGNRGFGGAGGAIRINR